MTLFKQAMVRGVCDRLQDLGVVAFPSEKIADAVCVKIAAALTGPDVLPEGGLDKESALLIGSHLKRASDDLHQAGYRPDATEILRSKQASHTSWPERAAKVAAAYMDKIAEGGSLTPNGENSLAEAAKNDQVAALEQRNRPQGHYLVGVGNTGMPSGGVVGQQQPHPESPSTSPAISSSLSATDKQANLDVASLLHDAKLTQLYNTLKGQKDLGGMSMKEFAGYHPTAANVAKGVGTVGALGAGAYGAKKLIDKLRGGGEGGEVKSASEDMAAADLSGGASPAAPADPGALQRAMLFLSAMKSKIPGFRPSPEAQVAAGGLGQSPQGLEVMAHVIDTVKTASEADDIIAQILNHQGEAGELASPELVAAIQQLMAQEQAGGEGAAAPADPPAPPQDAAAKEAALLAKLKQAADGSLTDVGKNTPESAAKTDQSAALDQKNRATKDYLVGQGKTEFPNKGQQFTVQTPDKAPEKTHPNTTPSRETKSAAVKMSAEEQAYVEELTKIAEVYGPKLPIHFTDEQKLACIKQLHGLAPSERNDYVSQVRNGA